MAGRGSRDDGAGAERFATAVLSAYQVISAVAAQVLRQELPDVTTGELAILRALDAEVVPRVSELTESLGLAPSTATRYCDHLERLGLIVRNRDTGDRREIRIGLTPKGLDAVRTTSARQLDALEERLRGIPEADRRQVIRTIHQLVVGDEGGRAAIA